MKKSNYISYYTKGRYMGREKITSFKLQYKTLVSWIRAGNDIKVDGIGLINDYSAETLKRIYS